MLYLLAVCLGYCLLLLPFFLDYRRMSRLRKMEGLNCRQVFAQLMELLHFGGLLLDVDGTEEDFPSRFHQAAPWVSRQEAARLQYIVSKAAYGDQKPTSKEEAFVAGLYHRTARELYDGLPKGKKLTFRYWRVFG